MMIRRRLQGFTLVEMIVVIVITGIIGGIVAMFLRAPVQGYVDSARRAELTDIADTALRRIARDLRLALPNSVRVTTVGANSYLEFIPTTGGGRYRSGAGAGTLCSAVAGNAEGDALSFTAADTCFQVLGAMPAVNVGNWIVVYNEGISDPTRGSNAYDGATTIAHNRRTVSAVGASTISITSGSPLPFDSCITDKNGYLVGGCRFQVVQLPPVTYVCTPVAGGAGGTLTRWQEATFSAAQPTAVPAGQPILATNVSACNFTYTVGISQRSSLVTMRLTISEQGIGEQPESVNLYAATHVNNVP